MFHSSIFVKNVGPEKVVRNLSCSLYIYYDSSFMCPQCILTEKVLYVHSEYIDWHSYFMYIQVNLL